MIRIYLGHKLKEIVKRKYDRNILAEIRIWLKRPNWRQKLLILISPNLNQELMALIDKAELQGRKKSRKKKSLNLGS